MRALVTAHFVVVVVVVLAAACGPGREDPPPGLDCEPDLSAGIDPTVEVSYAAEHMLCVKVTMDPDDFERLRHEERFVTDAVNLPCELGFTSPYNLYRADVAVDGVVVNNVSVRHKGFLGSLNPAKPSLKFKTDTFVDGQQLGDTERITLNNNSAEKTRLRTCFSYSIFAAAGVAAPRCNLATVVVNGEPFGVYTHVEPIKKRFLRNVFGNASGSLYEATLTDFNVDWLARFEAKTSDTDPNRGPIRLLSRVVEEPDDELFLAQLGELIDVDNFITFWAVEFLLGHGDGYTGGINNYFVYFDPADRGRARFIPWSADLTLIPEGQLPLPDDLAHFTRARIPVRLSRIPHMRDRFVDEVTRVLEDVWDESTLNARIDAFADLVKSGQDDSAYDGFVDELRTLVRERAIEARAMIGEGLPAAAEFDDLCIPGFGL